MIFVTKECIQLLLEQNTALTVITNNHTLESVGLNLGFKVLKDMLTYFFNAVRSLDQSLGLYLLSKVILLLLCELFGQSVEFFVDCILIHMKLYGNSFKVQRERSTVTDRVRERILTHISGRVLGRTKGCKGIVVKMIDRRTGQSEEECIGQSSAHICTEIAFLSSMRLVYHKNDIITLIKRRINLVKQEYCCNDDLAYVARQLVAEIVFILCNNKIGNVCGAERSKNLILEINTVKNDENGCVVEFLGHTKLLSRKYHQKRLATTLEVPNQAPLGLAAFNTLNHKVCAFVLLIAADNLDFTELLVRRINSEVTENIKNGLVFDHCHEASLNVSKSSFILAF